ncbi:Uncharacterised protein [Mycobacteroides abscessus subsp. abscessus]|nr:Uncharacterised protein [Mycobacteroides abscessus subsp. abscessus]
MYSVAPLRRAPSKKPSAGRIRGPHCEPAATNAAAITAHRPHITGNAGKSVSLRTGRTCAARSARACAAATCAGRDCRPPCRT